MTTAQQIADIAQNNFAAAMQQACKEGKRGAVWFAGCEYTFADGSVVKLRAGKIESPEASSIVWTAAKRVEFDV